MEQLALFDIGKRAGRPGYERIASMLAAAIDYATPQELGAILLAHKARFLGHGISRAVFALGGRVYKIECGGGAGRNQNTTEAEIAAGYPDLCPAIYGLMNGPRCSVLIAERAKPLSREQESDIWRICPLGRQYSRIRAIFQDAHEANLGMLRGRLILLDSGMGEWSSSRSY